MNANYKLLEDADGVATAAGSVNGGASAGGKKGRKVGGKKAVVPRSKKAASSKRLVELESADDASSSEEECEEEAATAAEAVDAMQKLLLATARKVGGCPQMEQECRLAPLLAALIAQQPDCIARPLSCLVHQSMALAALLSARYPCAAAGWQGRGTQGSSGQGHR
jgi:hypothetical protein